MGTRMNSKKKGTKIMKQNKAGFTDAEIEQVVSEML